MGQLAGFVGMLTDSRSLLSMTRHELFRRILCDSWDGTSTRAGSLLTGLGSPDWSATFAPPTWPASSACATTLARWEWTDSGSGRRERGDVRAGWPGHALG